MTGGLAVYLHIDYIRDRLPETTRVAALADAGFFLDLPDWNGVPSYTPHYRKVCICSCSCMYECLHTYM